MDLEEMLKEHQRWLEKAHKSLTSAGAADLTQSRINQLHAGIAELERQKEREVQRYDTAIAALQRELATVSATSHEGASKPEKKPSKTAKAKKGKK
ncbi:hypothetical protein [Bradyrhizobium liaoningense]|uniref:hypothetical protein n=1 Tax=Bradyrhizobium liaoningense TaxID=43992 RepID=UPI001BA85F23|nr:hypothetical protein [Bradyrhizobium liaoningense]MBR0713536.1 hypothetical protein [Bradyrhizobium liaoningense]